MTAPASQADGAAPRAMTAADVQEARIRAAVEADVAAAPPLSDAQIVKLRAIFRPVIDEMSSGGAA